MKKTLKLIAVMLVLVMAFGMLAACGNDTPAPSPSDSQPVEPQPSETTPAEPTMGDPVDRAEYNIPEQYTKVKTFFGTYGFGDAEIVTAMNDDETAFYIQFVCFDEAQILEGTVSNGICVVTYDKYGFVSADCQVLYEDSIASEELWCPLVGEAVAPMGDPVDRAEYNIPAQYTKVKTFFGTYGFGDAEIITAMNDDETAFYIQFVCFDEAQILEGTVSNGICIVTYDKYGFVSADCQVLYEDSIASEELWCPLVGEAVAPMADPVDRNEYAIPDQYTKVKTFFGTYGFGDAEIITAMNDDETAFYIQFVCFDEAQILEGTVSNGICIVTYDKYGFVSADCQILYEDSIASEELWAPLTGTLVAPVSRADYEIPEQYTKVKIFFGTYGFGDAEIVSAMNEDETAFYIQFVCFDEAQILEGTVSNGICIVTYDKYGFVSADCQILYEDTLASEEPWAPLQ